MQAEPDNSGFEAARQKLADHVDERQDAWLRSQKYYSRMNGLVVGVSLILSASVTIAGIFDKGILAAVLGVLLGLTLGVQQAWPLSEKNFFYRAGKAEAFALQLQLERRRLSQKELDDLRAKFGALNLRMNKEVPRGTAVQDVVQSMREEVQNARANQA